VIALAGRALPGALLGATFNQYVAGQDSAFRNLAGKLEAGAVYVQTQPVFDLDAYEAAAIRIRKLAPEARIVPMVMPLVTMEAADRISARLGVAIPEWVRAPGDPWLVFEEILTWLRTSGLADAVAVMTYEMDPPPDAGAHITRSLRNAGILPHAAG
jgi:hypothetical protein